MKIMLDTNILVSAIFFPTAQTHRFVREVSVSHRLVLCDYVIEELRLVVERKFPSKKEPIENFFAELPFEYLRVPKCVDAENIPSVRDQKDTPIIAAAINENVDVFVTGDKDFLVLNIKVPEIMTMTEFLEKYA